MRPKFLSLIGAFLSALGISYFAAKTLSELGDWGVMWQQEPRIIIVALAATLVPLGIAGGVIWRVEQARDGFSQVMRLVWLTALAWGWLYIGLIVVGLMRLQLSSAAFLRLLTNAIYMFNINSEVGDCPATV